MQSRLVRLLVVCAVPASLVAQAPDSSPADTAARSLPLTSGGRIGGARLDSLPVDDPVAAFAHIPGVFLRGGDVGILPNASFSIRGGMENGAATFVDGAPVRSQLTGAPLITPALNGIASVDVITGLAGAELSDAQGGVVSYRTPRGGDHLVTHWTAHTDEPFSSPVSVGYNRFSGLVSGPVPGARGLSFFASGMLQGQSSEYLGAGAQDVPTYVMGGMDTTITVPIGGGGGTTTQVLPRFVQWSGSCDAGTNGAACQGLSRPMDWRTLIQLQGNVRWTYGNGSSVSITGLAAGIQSRQFPGTLLGDPLLFNGEHDWSRLAVLNWHHTVNPALSVEAVMSLGTDRFISGPLTSVSELSSRDPSLGIELSTLGFSSLAGLGLPLSDQIIRNIRTYSGLRVPYLGQTQLSDFQDGRLNPYAMAGGNLYNGGVNAPLTFASERQVTGRWQATWRHAAHAVTVGVDTRGSDLTSYTAPSLLSAAFLDAWTASPTQFGLFAADRLRLGRVLIDAVLRYDRVNPGGELPVTPGFVFNDPNWSPLAATSDSAYAGSVSRVFQPTRDQSFVTPRIHVAAPIGPTTVVGLSAGEQLETPPAFAVADNSNSDLSFTNADAPFGRDVSYTASRMVELDVHQVLSYRARVDLGTYYRGHIPSYGYLIQNFDDPTNCQIVNGVRTCRQLTLNVLSRGETTHVWGIEVAAHQNLSDAVQVSALYSLAKSGAGGGVDLAANARAIAGVTGSVLPPGGSSSEGGTAEHAIGLSLDAVVSDRWAADGWRKALQRVAASAQFRMISGLPYTPLVNQGDGVTGPNENIPSGAMIAGNPGSASLPWTRYLDLRITKGVRANGLDWTIFADFRNLLNTRNLDGLFAETGDVTNALFETNVISGEFPVLANEASINGALGANNSVVLTNCANWQGSTGPLDCVMLQRAEARFGNGDGTFTQAEQTKAFDAYYQMLHGAWRFYGPQRTIRVGLELAF